MTAPRPLDVWELDPDVDPQEAERIATARVLEPRFGAVVISASARLLTLQVVRGAPGGAASARFHVEGLGLFELLRREEWPPAPGQRTPRILLVLRSAAPA